MIPLSFIDSHAHLDRDVYDEDRASVLERARQAGVTRIINIALGPEIEALESAHTFALETPGTFLAVGVHPHDVSRMTDESVSLVRAYSQKERVVAIGEIGLDYHYDYSPREMQRARFREFLELAIAVNLPVIIHSREAFDDTLAILSETEALSKVGGVLHCFGGTAQEAQKYLALGAHIGFAGIVTFKKATNIHEAAKVVPWERILIETDAPFLAPEPYRGKRNESAFVVRVAEKLAELKGSALPEVAQVTTQNAERLFRLPSA